MNVIYEDEAILVADKPAGQIVHPAPGHEGGALSDEFVARCPSAAAVGSKEHPGVVHRLDRGTSGVIVLAKTQDAYLELRRQFESHRDVRKTYLAVCHGAPRPAKGVVDQPVGRDRRRAVSRYEVLGRSGPLALVRFDIETGRLHQVRLHAKALGHPVVGDPEHGDAAAFAARERLGLEDRRLRARPSRMMLHAVELSFLHPTTHRRVTFVAPPPAALAAAALA